MIFRPSGFVLLATDGRENPILGWSTDSEFPKNPDHPLNSWLIGDGGRQTAVGGHRSSVVGHRSSVGLKSSLSTDQFVSPLIAQRWGQGEPWNMFCPLDHKGKHAPVGCVAVAMAQIMKKWNWPNTGNGSNRYVPPRYPAYGAVEANFGETVYHWDKMDPVWPMDNTALLLFHAGVASFMNYSPGESATSVDHYAINALSGNFYYNKGMIYHDMEDYSFLEWTAMIRQELINGRPLLYSGSSPDGQVNHAFNIDGFRDEDYFHFNWGWNGIGDGWYTLSGMAGGTSDFSRLQGAIFGIQPDNMPLHDRPSGLEVMPGNGYVKLIWNKPGISDLSHYVIYRDGEPAANTIHPYYQDTTLENGKTYRYHVIASYMGINPGESEPTPEQSVMPWQEIQLPYVQDFENGLQGWSVSGSETGFVIGKSTDLEFGGNGSQAAGASSMKLPPGIHVADYLTSPVFFPTDTTHVAMSFRYVFKQNPGIDKLYLVWRNFTDGAWRIIMPLDSTGGWADWKTEYLYLPDDLGPGPVQLAFYYNDLYGEGFGAAFDDIRLYGVHEKAVPGFQADAQDICLDQIVTFTDTTQGLVDTWEWDFGEGAVPRFATTKGPHQILYTKTGHHTVKLSTNHLDHLEMNQYIAVRAKPVADFTWVRDFMTVRFTSTAQNAERVEWQFGDGTTSTENNPAHKFIKKDLFEITQIAYSGTCDPDTLRGIIDMRSPTGIEDEPDQAGISIFPNPAGEFVNLVWNFPPPGCVKISVISSGGRILADAEYTPQKLIRVGLEDFPEGLYILRVVSEEMVKVVRVVRVTGDW